MTLVPLVFVFLHLRSAPGTDILLYNYYHPLFTLVVPAVAASTSVASLQLITPHTLFYQYIRFKLAVLSTLQSTFFQQFLEQRFSS